MTKTLIIYSTTDGHTEKVCSFIKKALETHPANEVSLVEISKVNADILTNHDKIVLGASIRYGKHSQSVYDFVHTHHALLNSKASAFFSVNLVARKSEKNTVNTNPYIKKFFSQIAWTPTKAGVFAGKLDYRKYGLIDRLMIRFIMWMTKGPTDPKACIEFTDWNSVENFAEAINTM